MTIRGFMASRSHFTVDGLLAACRIFIASAPEVLLAIAFYSLSD